MLNFPSNHREPENLQEKKPLTESLDLSRLRQIARFMPPEQVRKKVEMLNRRIKMVGQSHEVEVAVDPTAHTWACARIPKKQVLHNGSVVDTNYFHYIIVMPYEHLAIEDEDFILGELRHEFGHALYTDWRLMDNLGKQTESQGYPKEVMSVLLNCLEDPRMEHVSVLPKHIEGYIQQWFWSKNKQLILPNIGGHIAGDHPVNQFDFLIKLFSLWQIHSDNAEKEGIQPWDDVGSLHPRVQELWQHVRPTVERLVGVRGFSRPEMRSSEIKKAIEQVIWPAKKALIDEFGAPPENPNPEPGHGGDGPPGDPDNIENLPPDLQKILKQKIEQYKKKIEGEKQAQIERNKNAEKANKEIEKRRNKRQEKTDGISSAETRKKYNELKREASVVEQRMGRIFEKYFPKIAYPKDTYSYKGKKYSAREHLRRYGTGLEKPMATPNVPEKAGFVLQLIVDVSGSMKSGRIDEVIKTVIGILEASTDYPIYIEVLASDDKHGGIDEKYILKSFDDEFSGASGGRVKERLVGALTQFGGDNKDADSLRWAIPRIEKKKKELISQYDKMAVLTIFLSDAEIEGQQDPNVVNELRRKVPILGGCIENNPNIKNAVQKAYGPIGEGSFCPDSLHEFPNEIEKILRKKIRTMFRT